jgi:hypothetical protein
MKLAYAKPDGGVAIVHAAAREVLALVVGTLDENGAWTLSEADYLAHVLQRNGLSEEGVVRLPDDWTPPTAPRASWVLANGRVSFDPQKAAAAYQQVFAAAIDRHIDKTAKARDYDSGESLAGYVNSTIPAWAAEAQAFVTWRDAVWVYAYQELASVTQGQRTQPAVAEFIAKLPQITWPS